jgi:imidazolonepropionase
MQVDLIIHNAKQLVTCAAPTRKAKKGSAMQDVGIIENGAVAIKNGVIESLGDSQTILRNFSAAEIIDAERKTICPGFVECHTHIVFAGNRLNEFELKIKGADYLEILASGGGILSTVNKTREAEFALLVRESSHRLDKMLALGTTTCEIKTGYGLNEETEIKMLWVIFELDKLHPIDVIPTFLPAHTTPSEFNGKTDEYVDLICQKMLRHAALTFVSKTLALDSPDTVSNKYGVTFSSRPVSEAEQLSVFQNNPFFVDVFCEKNAFDLAQSRKILETAKKIGFRLKAHVDEFTNLGGARMAIELGATSIDHLDQISDGEIKLLAESETIGVITPTVNFNFGSTHFADARKMIDSGCAIALSTDYNPGSAPCPSLPNAMAIACRYQKLLPSEALNAVTINAAHALDIGNKCGSIENGKQADLIILDTDDYRQLAYEFGGNLIQTVIKNGKKVHPAQ